jgi:hypothetical protein
MIPLAGGTTADVFLVARVTSQNLVIAALAATVCVAPFTGRWVVLPWRARPT